MKELEALRNEISSLKGNIHPRSDPGIDSEDTQSIDPGEAENNSDSNDKQRKKRGRGRPPGGGNKFSKEEKLQLEAGSFVEKLTKFKNKKMEETNKKSEKLKIKKQKTNQAKER
jgi:hypothetical protein